MAPPVASNVPKSATAASVSSTKSKSLKKTKTMVEPAITPPAHPTYLQMSAEAISVLKERTGSSAYAIAKWLEGKYKGLLPSNFKKMLHRRLKMLAEKGKLVQIKNSYKLSDELKKSMKKDVNLNPFAKKTEEKITMPAKKDSRTTTGKMKVKSINKIASAKSPNVISRTKVSSLSSKGANDLDTEKVKPASRSVNKLSKSSTKSDREGGAKTSTKSSKTKNVVEASTKPATKAVDVPKGVATRTSKTSTRPTTSVLKKTFNVPKLASKPFANASPSKPVKKSKRAKV